VWGAEPRVIACWADGAYQDSRQCGVVQEAKTANGDTKKMGQAIRANLEAHTVKPDI